MSLHLYGKSINIRCNPYYKYKRNTNKCLFCIKDTDFLKLGLVGYQDHNCQRTKLWHPHHAWKSSSDCQHQ